MRDKPTMRIPLGVLCLLIGIGLYTAAIVWASQWIELIHPVLQAVVYLFLGVVWLLPLKRFLIWMETGKWR
jgi:CHASE2 domain-containing sensor protein